jgi:RNA polymerase sigma-70 factor (ECF subfamily)
MSSAVVDDARDSTFERLYERYSPNVHRYVLTLVRNPAEAEDVTQTTFLNAYRALRAGEVPERPENWLIAIAHNACRSRTRHSMRRPREVPLDDVVSQLAVLEPEKPNIRELLRALGRLPSNQRTALTMRELEGRSYPEIAETLGVTVGAVEALIARARRTLRTQASALRGLFVFQLPRSLRRLFESGEAAVGGGAVAKAAAVLVAGVVAGGVGSSIIVARTPRVPRVIVHPSRHDPAPAGASRTHRTPIATGKPAHRAAVPGRPTQTTQTGTPPGSGSVPPTAGAAAPPAAVAPAPPQVHAPVQSQLPAQPSKVVAAVQQAVDDVVPALPVAVPQLPAIPPTPAVPPLPAPPVDVPALPTLPPVPVPPVDVPPLPQPPGLPSLPTP